MLLVLAGDEVIEYGAIVNHEVFLYISLSRFLVSSRFLV